MRDSFATSFLAMVLALLIFDEASGRDDPIDVGAEKQLFVDDFVVASTKNIERLLGRVEKDSRPIFAEGADHGWFYGTVLYDQGRFKMWHRNRKGYGYAESTTGVEFQQKAVLEGINFAGDYTLAVELNRLDADPAHRFIAGYDAPGMAMGIAHSADGIHWTPYNGGKPVTYRAADTYNQVFWDPWERTYRLITRTDFGSGGGPRERTIAKDFEVRGSRLMTNPDIQKRPADWNLVKHMAFIREGPKEYLRRQIYSMTVWQYSGVYFGLVFVYDYPADISEGREVDYVRRHERNVLNFYLATSRDCEHWDFQWVYAGQPLVPRGPDRSFDKDSVAPASTIVTLDERHWLYYQGNNERHTCYEVDPPLTTEPSKKLGLATLRLDGFVRLHAGFDRATVVTRPFVLEGDRLQVNVDASAGDVRVEVLDAGAQPIAGYSGESAKAYERVDALRLEPTWSQPLSALRGKKIRLRFSLRFADLYAFQVR